jgi:hypothetical protein
MGSWVALLLAANDPMTERHACHAMNAVNAVNAVNACHAHLLVPGHKEVCNCRVLLLARLVAVHRHAATRARQVTAWHATACARVQQVLALDGRFAAANRSGHDGDPVVGSSSSRSSSNPPVPLLLGLLAVDWLALTSSEGKVTMGL